MTAKTYTFREQMKAHRAQNGLTQKQLGELLGVKQAVISRIESGQKQAPRSSRPRSRPYRPPPLS